MTPVARLREWLLTGRLPEPGSPSEALDLASAAHEQGLAGLLHGAVQAAVPPWPREALEVLGGLRVRLGARALRQGHVLDRTLDLLARSDLRALPLKGAALVGLVYDDTGERPMADIDLLAVNSFEESLAVLVGAGFAEVDRADHAVALLDPETDSMVELHLSPTSCPGFYAVDPRELWERGIALGDNPEHRRPSNEDLLLMMCLHAAFQHGLRLRLVNWLDFRRVTERLAVDGVVLRERAIRWRSEAAVFSALVSAGGIVGAPIVPGLVEDLGARLPRELARWVESLVERPEELLPRGNRMSITDLARARWRLAAGRHCEWLARTLVPAGWGSRTDRLPIRLARRVFRLAHTWGWRLVAAQSGSREPASAAGIAEGSDIAGPELVAAVLESADEAHLTVTGDCMRPALAPGERVRLVRAQLRRPRLGDVVLVSHPSGLHLHRLVWAPPLTRARWRTQADRAVLLDPAVGPSAVLATAVDREGDPGRSLRRPARAFVSLARAVWWRVFHASPTRSA